MKRWIGLGVGLALGLGWWALGSRTIEAPADYATRLTHYATIECRQSNIVRKMYVSPTALAAAQQEQPLPVGTLIVMETHAARAVGGRLEPVSLSNVFLREKRASGGQGGWHYAWRGVPTAQASCTGCHQQVQGRDYVFTLPQLQQAARTGQPVRQPTEFGTGVCR